MEPERNSPNAENFQRKYSIYLVGFPETTETDDSNSISAVIQDLVPEARVRRQSIFSSIEAPNDSESQQDLDDDIKADNTTFESLRGREADDQPRSRNQTGNNEPHEIDNFGVKQSVATLETPEYAENGIEIIEYKDSVAVQDVIESAGSVISTTEHDFFLSSWMQVEALKLLSQIKKHVADSKDDMGKVLLAGYGFGGFVVKQAIVLSNTIPTFYGIALDISSLVFFNTPHESTGHLTWEEFLLHMLRETNRSYRGHLSRILSELVESVSQLSHSFNTFASKYPTSDFIQGEYARIAKIDKSSEDVVVWDNESGSVDSLKRFPLGSLEKQKSLRKHFAPCHILSSLRKHRLKNEMMNMTSPEEYKRAYFGILQVLSSSRWILYEPKVLERPEEFYSLQEIYGSVVQKISFKTIRGGSLEIIGPTGSGKSAVIKLLLQSMTQKSSLTVINNFMDSSGAPSGSLYSILVSSIHQIVSQRPHLFPYIRNLMDHVTGQSTWTEPVVRAALWSLFQHSEFTDFLIIIHDFDLCPTEVKSWWLHIQSSLAMSSTSTCTFIIGSRGSCAEFPAGTQYRIDLSKTRDHNKRILVSNNVQHFFQHYYNLSPSYEAFSEDTNFKEDLQQKIIKKTGKFKGSMSSIKLYLGRLFQSFTLSSIPAIERSLSICPTTEEALYEERLLALSHESKEILNWASAVLHWIVLSVRSLRVEELAVAAALSTKHGQISDLKLEISMDVKRDLYKNLGGLVSVENEHVCLVSPLVKELWTRETHVSQDAHNNLTILCLHYLQLILDDQNSQSVKSFLYPMSQTNHSEGVEDNEMMFLHYACYFWPVHFLRAKTPSEQAKTAVAAFLLMPSRSGKWFRLYFTGTLSNGQAIPNVPAPEVTAKILDDIEEEPDSQKCAIMMASHFGLYSVIPYLSDTEESDGLSDTKESGGDSRELWVRQGCVEFKREFSNAPSTQDLEYYILNNDDIAVQTIIHSDHEALNHSFLLHKAASAGSQKVVTVLYGLLDNPMQRDQKGRTPLHVAAICGHVDIVNFFVAQNTPIDGTSEIKTPNAIDIQDKELKTCLMMAIQSGHVEISQHLAQSGSNLTLTDITGRSAIHYAVLFCPQILDILIAQNKDIIYMRDNGGQTPLHFIAQCGKSDLTEVILSAARESGRLSEVITAVDAQGMTALHHASENGYTAIAQVLTNEMDNKQEKDSLGRLAADMAAENGHLATLQAIASNNLYGGHSSLIAASRAGQLLIVEYLLQRGIDPNSSEFTDHTPLTIASAHGWTGIARALLNHGAELDLGDSERRTPLHHAAKNGMKEVALILLTYKSNVHITTTNVNAPDVLRYTPLHYASMAGDVDVMRLLLKHNADVNAHSRDQETPLHLSVHNADAVELLLDKGAEIDNVDILDQTPLLKAVKNEHQESAKLLISRQANIYMRDNDGKNVLHYAIAQDNIVIFELLHRKYNTPINNEPGNLELAVRRAALKVLKSMLDKNPDAITSTILRGRTLLGLAAGFDSLDVVTFLLDVGSDPNQTTSGARTPLHEAAASGRVRNVMKLIEKGAKVDEVDSERFSALYFAARQGHLEIVEVLISATAMIDQNSSYGTPLYIAAYHGRAQIVDRLLKADANPNVEAGSDKWSPLHAAADNVKIARRLIESGAEINHQKLDNWSPLHLSASWGIVEVVSLLLEKGANPNLKNDAGDTALHLAIRNNRREVVKIFMNYHESSPLDLNIKDGNGNTAIHAAITECSSEEVKMLLDRGADLKAKTEDGATYLDVAIEHHQVETIKLLLSEKYLSSPNTPWDMADLVSAYWRALKKDFEDIVRVLIEKHNDLVNQKSEEGLNGLEVYLHRERPEYEEETLSKLFIDLGLSPFQRQQNSQTSCFELGIISRRILNTDFFDGCVNYISEDVESLGIGLKELRIATELGRSDLWAKLKPLMKKIGDEVDQDGWNIHSFLHQASPRGNYDSYERDAALRKTKTTTALEWPKMWQKFDREHNSSVEFSGGLMANFLDRHDDSRKGAITLRGNFPFPPRESSTAPSYFEVSILAASNERVGSVIAIGLASEFTNLSHAIPGWNLWSIGYHSDDGGIYQESWDMARSVKPYGVGQTVGCGVDYRLGQYFFTLDGEVVFRRSSNLIFRKLYPVIGHHHDAGTIKVNFGEADFVWWAANVSRAAER